MEIKKAFALSGCLVGGMVALLGLNPQSAHAASAAAATATGYVAPPAPPEPPPSVPADVNPFAEGKILPVPLKWPGAARPRLDVDVHQVSYDGMELMELFVTGPDFEWQFEPLPEFLPAPVGFTESMAFTYQTNSSARLAWSLYGETELLPDFTPNSLAQYLAAIRAVEPKDFVLLTPFSKNAQLINSDSICGFQAQAVDYAIVSATDVTFHHDWFIDLNHQYILLVTLSGPRALVQELTPRVHYFLARSRVLKGLGVKEEKPATAKPAGTVPPNT